jgi:hypothetical protein
VTTRNVDATLADDQGRIGLTLVEQGPFDASLAESWGCPGNAGVAMGHDWCHSRNAAHPASSVLSSSLAQVSLASLKGEMLGWTR